MSAQDLTAPVEYGQTLPKSTLYRAFFTGCSGRLHGLFWPGRQVPWRWDSGTEAHIVMRALPGGPQPKPAPGQVGHGELGVALELD